ncbi:MAG: trypsin-like peptidase domain-containing protein [Clostridia bacterium]|nr:trypsin-like peptidase domain-containing protein [Clostridia bacterium]
MEEKDPKIEFFTDPISTVNDDGDRQRTVAWREEGGPLQTQTTIIHKKVPSAGVIVLTAFVFTVLGALIASLVFLARFVDVKSIASAIGETKRTSVIETPLPEQSSNGASSDNDAKSPSAHTDPNVALPTPAPPEDDPVMNFGAGLNELYDENAAGVVIVNSYSGVPRSSAHTGTGSGFFITDDGYILTNAHVVEDAANVRITTYDGSEYDAVIVGSDVRTDMAVLRAPEEAVMKTLTIGDSSRVRTGDFVLAIGHPTGEELSFTATFGMVGAIERSVTIDGVRNDYIQIDAAINPGNSGGPLFDMNGLVIGVNSAKTVVASYDENGEPITAEGLGFALPIGTAMETARELIAQGGIVRPGIGLSTVFVTPETAEKYGIPVGGLVYTVTEGGPAHEAGLYADDIITQADDVKIEDNEALGAYIRTKTYGDSVEITYWRDGEYHTCTLTVGDLNAIGSKVLDDAYGGAKYGIRVR